MMSKEDINIEGLNLRKVGSTDSNKCSNYSFVNQSSNNSNKTITTSYELVDEYDKDGTKFYKISKVTKEMVNMQDDRYVVYKIDEFYEIFDSKKKETIYASTDLSEINKKLNKLIDKG